MSILTDFRERCTEHLVPLQATLELTYRCNERCGHCYLATYDDFADGRPPLTLSEWKKILDQLAQARTLLLVLIGGEAMMHPHFWEISSHAADRNFGLTLITNGLLIDERAAEKLSALGFYQVTLSLYSTDPSVHDKMTRRKGSHARILAAIENLRRFNVGVGINCLLTSENIDRCFELRDWAIEKNLTIQFDPLVTPKSDGTLDSTTTRATAPQLARYYQTLKSLGRGPTPMPVAGPDEPICNAGRGKCAVNPYGDLLTCLEVRDPIGSLREKSFQELWTSDKAAALRQNRNRDLKFDPACGDGAFCDHCPGMAKVETGDALKAVPFLMEVARIKRQVYETV